MTFKATVEFELEADYMLGAMNVVDRIFKNAPEIRSDLHVRLRLVKPKKFAGRAATPDSVTRAAGQTATRTSTTASKAKRRKPDGRRAG